MEKLNCQANERKDSPLHIALESMNRKTIRSMLALNPNLAVINAQGNSYAMSFDIISTTVYVVKQVRHVTSLSPAPIFL